MFVFLFFFSTRGSSLHYMIFCCNIYIYIYTSDNSFKFILLWSVQRWRLLQKVATFCSLSFAFYWYQVSILPFSLSMSMPASYSFSDTISNIYSQLCRAWHSFFVLWLFCYHKGNNSSSPIVPYTIIWKVHTRVFFLRCKMFSMLFYLDLITNSFYKL